MQQANRAATFEREYPRLYERMWRYVRPRLSSDTEAEDVVAEAMLDGFRTLHNFDATKGTLEQWLFGVTRHKLMKTWNARGPMVDLGELAHFISDETHSVEVTADMKLRCQKVMSKIPADLHPIIMMRFTEGMTFDEISKVTGKTSTSLRQTLSRTFRRVRSELAGVIAVALFIGVATYFVQSKNPVETVSESESMGSTTGDYMGLAQSQGILGENVNNIVWMIILFGTAVGVLLAFMKRDDR